MKRTRHHILSPRTLKKAFNMIKDFFGVIFGIGAWIVMIWLGASFIGGAKGEKELPPITTALLLGGLVVPIGLYGIWARRKGAVLHQWIANILFSLYFSGMFLILALKLLGVLVPQPWNTTFQVVILGLYVGAWLLPLVAYPWAKWLERQGILFRFLFFISIVFTTGALISLYEGDIRFPLGLILAILLSIGSAQEFALQIFGPSYDDRGGTDDVLAPDGYLGDNWRLTSHGAGPAVEETGRWGVMEALRSLFRRPSPQALLDRGTWQVMTGEYVKAVKTLSKALKRDPHLAEAYLHRGIAYLEMNRVEEALQDLDQAVKLLPQEPLAYYNRALAWMAREDWDRAEADLEQAVDLAPEDAKAWNLLAIVRSQAGKVDQALEAIEQAIALGHPAGWRNRAIILEKAGRLDEALAAWEVYAGQGKREAVYARARRGLLLWQMGRETEAQEEVAWAWKRRRRRLDPFTWERLRKVRREMRRKRSYA